MTIDGRVNGLNRQVFEALQKVKNPQDISVDEAKSIRSAVMKDGKVDEMEQDLLLELTQDKHQSIAVAADPGTGFNPQAMHLGPAKGQAGETLAALTRPTDLNSYWNQGKDGLTKMVDLYGISPATKNEVTRFAAGKFLESWNESNMANGYAPLRGLLYKGYSALQQMDPETANQGRQLYFDAMKMVDHYTGDKIPDFLYNWIRPGGLI